MIGAVTQETPSLVSPGGVSTIDFGDPVVAINTYGDLLTDGDAGNGEADVLIATLHEGAPEDQGGTVVSLQQQPDASPVFANNVGQIQLTADSVTDEVTSCMVANVARVTDDDASLIAAYPALTAVNTTVQDVIAAAAVIGDQPKGTIAADITTAFSGGTYVNGVYTGGIRDDRASESALGNEVANALLASLSGDRGDAQIGVVNSGALRAELLYAPDGVVTYAEANGVLPFVNNLWTVTLTGAQCKDVLEQQWQTNPDGTVPSRPNLQLGLSNNVTYT